MILICETFGPTIQGEGSTCGRVCHFIRTAGCDYACEWCDTKYAWAQTREGGAQQIDVAQLRESVLSGAVTVEEALFEVAPAYHVVLTGGNPCTYPGLGLLIDLLHEVGIGTTVETQGSVWQDWVNRVGHLVIAPKLPSSGMWGRTAEDVPAFCRELAMTTSTEFKYVVSVEDEAAFWGDVDAIQALEEMLPGGCPTTFRTVQPMTSPDVHPDDVPAQALQNYELLLRLWLDSALLQAQFSDIRILPQLHRCVWGNKRGV
jgi:7-carboxy-7-deazaguanine synthase